MKYKLAIIYGIITWILISVVTISLTEHTTNMDLPFSNIIIPACIIIIITFFSILYIRNFDSNEVVEGLKLGIVFVIIDIIFDYIFFILQNNYNLIGEYTTHLLSTVILIIMITTFIGYLAQMTIELR